MGQTVRYKDEPLERRYEGVADAAACPAAGLTTIASIRNPGKKLLCFHFDVATQNIDDLDVFGRAHPDGQLQDFTPADWTALPSGGRIRRCARSTTATGAVVDGNLNSVTTAQNGYFEMEVDGLAEIVVKASGAVNDASVTPRWSLQ